jgi:hypothetical protein
MNLLVLYITLTNYADELIIMDWIAKVKNDIYLKIVPEE